MGKVVIDMSMSLDGYIAAPNDNPEQGLGEDGMRLFLKKGRLSSHRLVDGTSSGAPGRLAAHLFLGVCGAHRGGGSCPGFSVP
jgi:hypothetical protein